MRGFEPAQTELPARPIRSEVLPTMGRVHAGVSVITRDRIEAAMGRLALAIDTPGGEVYLPVYESLERDLAELDREETALHRACRRAREAKAAAPRSLAA